MYKQVSEFKTHTSTLAILTLALLLSIYPGSCPHSSPISDDSTPPKTSPSSQPLTVTTPPHPPSPGI